MFSVTIWVNCYLIKRKKRFTMTDVFLISLAQEAKESQVSSSDIHN